MDSEIPQPPSPKKNLSRRQLLFGAGAAVAGSALASEEILSLLPIQDDEPSSLTSLPNIDEEGGFGDHVFTQKEITTFLDKNPQATCFVGGELCRDNFITAKHPNWVPLPTEEQDESLNLVDLAMGIGTSQKKGYESIQACASVLQRGDILYAVDTNVRGIKSGDLMEKYTHGRFLTKFIGITTGLGGIGTVMEQTLSKKNEKDSRRTFLKHLAIGGAATVATAIGLVKGGHMVAHGEFARKAGNYKAEFMKKLLLGCEHAGIQLFSGEETKVFAETLIDMRSMNMMRNYDIVTRMAQENRDKFPTQGDKVPVYFGAGSGHTDMILYRDQTHDEQDNYITNHANNILDYYMQHIDTNDTQATSSLEISDRIAALGMIGFGIPAAEGAIINEVHTMFNAPDHLPKTPALIFIEQLMLRAQNETDPHKQTVLEDALLEYSRLLKSNYFSITRNDEVYDPQLFDVSETHLYPDQPNGASLNGQETIRFPSFEGHSLEQILHAYGYTPETYQSGVFYFPYGYINHHGVPRIVMGEIIQQTDGLHLAYFTGGKNERNWSVRIYTDNPDNWSSYRMNG